MDEPKLVTNEELLLQVLRNQYDIMRALQENVGGHHLGWYPSMGDKLKETEALLDRAEAKIEPT